MTNKLTRMVEQLHYQIQNGGSEARRGYIPRGKCHNCGAENWLYISRYTEKMKKEFVQGYCLNCGCIERCKEEKQ